MRCIFLHKYFDNEQIVILLVSLQGDQVSISERHTGIFLGTLGWANNQLTGDSSFLPTDVIVDVTRKLVVGTTRVEPVYVDQPVEEPEGELAGDRPPEEG